MMVVNLGSMKDRG